MKRVLGILVGILALAALVLGARYITWRGPQLESLRAGSQIAETARGPIEYVLSGSDGEPVLLFLHGTPGGCDQTVPAREGVRVLSPSRPGYLRTPIETGRTPAEQADAYAALLDVLGIEAVAVMGASGGGPSALAFAARHPSRTLAVIAMEAVSQPMADDEPAALPPSDFLSWLFLSALGMGGVEALAEGMIPDPDNRDRLLRNPVAVEQFRAVMWSLWPPSLRNVGFDNDIEQFAQFDIAVEAIRAPMLIVHGTADESVPLVHAEDLAKRVPHAESLIVEGADHMMPFTHAGLVDERVEAFMLSVPRAP